MVGMEMLSAAWGCDPTSAEMARRLDDQDKLAGFRDEFVFPKMKTKPGVDLSLVDPEDSVIYLNGNSLGLKPKKADQYCMEVLQQWGDWGHETHFGGTLPAALCDLELCRQHARLVGANNGEVVLMNGLTVNLHLLLTAFYRPDVSRHKILMEEKAFPSDRYAIISQIRQRGYRPESSLLVANRRAGEDHFRTEDVVQLIRKHGHEISVILIGGVHYFTGQKFDMERITEVGHEMGCIVGFDLAHAIGNVELQLHRWGVDFACWCTYKYLNSGPGCVGGAFVHQAHDHSPLLKLEGWWSNKLQTRFQMLDKVDSEIGALGFRLSNPPQLLFAVNKASMEIFERVSMADLLEKQLLLTGYLEMMMALLVPEAHQVTPRDPQQRGCQLTFKIHNLSRVHTAIRRRGVECDLRLDDNDDTVVRLAPVPLYNSFQDVYRLVHIVRDSIDSHGHLSAPTTA